MLFLVLPVLIAALPVLGAYLYLHFGSQHLRNRVFFICLLSGMFAIVPAALLQYLVPPFKSLDLKGLLLNVFLRVAFVEEASRFLLLLPVVLSSRSGCLSKITGLYLKPTAAGLVAGLGFALAESAIYSVNGYALTILRNFTAAPLHAACGTRVGKATGAKPLHKGLPSFLSAVLIHGAYNILTVTPGRSRFLVLLVCALALFSAIQMIKGDKNAPEIAL